MAEKTVLLMIWHHVIVEPIAKSTSAKSGACRPGREAVEHDGEADAREHAELREPDGRALRRHAARSVEQRAADERAARRAGGEARVDRGRARSRSTRARARA